MFDYRTQSIGFDKVRLTFDLVRLGSIRFSGFFDNYSNSGTRTAKGNKNSSKNEGHACAVGSDT